MKEDEMGWACSTRGEKRNTYRFSLGGKAKRSKPLGRPRHRWENNMKMDLRKIVWGDMDRIHLAQDRIQFEGCCEHGNEPSGSIKCCETLE
jgi:hypothetical protein